MAFAELIAFDRPLAGAVAPGSPGRLCDETELEYRLGTTDTFEAAAFMAENAPHVAKVAIVFGPNPVEDVSFWQTVARNRGLVVRTFKDLPAAEEWLTEMAGRGQAE